MRFLVIILIFSLFVCTGCDTEAIVDECTYGLNPVTLFCNAAPSGDASQAPVDTGQNCRFGVNPRTGQCFQQELDAGGTAPDTGKTVAEDASLPTGPVDGTCTASDPQNLKIGMPCSSHTQCDTCYCYDEAYLSPFRFCTKDCSSGSGSECPLGDGPFPEFACLKFTASQVNNYGLKHGGICMPRCESLSECALYAPDYDYCPPYTKWEDFTVQAASTCQIQSLAN